MNTKATKKQPRGIRNNNPLNIRIGNSWLGEVPNPTDSDFEQFVSVVYGLRAAFYILRRYIHRYHRDTISKIIHAWAPANENDTDLYISKVAGRVGISPDATICYEDAETMYSLVQAMAMQECGQRVSEDSIEKAYKLA